LLHFQSKKTKAILTELVHSEKLDGKLIETVSEQHDIEDHAHDFLCVQIENFSHGVSFKKFVFSANGIFNIDRELLLVVRMESPISALLNYI
jgi:hypothetical protein